MSDWPTVAQELDRKVIEEMERLLHQHTRHEISNEQYNRAILTIWQVAAGLVPRETMEILALEPADTALLEYRAEKVLLHKSKPIALKVMRHRESVIQELNGFENGEWTTKSRRYDCEDGPEAAERFAAILQSALNQDFHAI